MHHLGPPGQNDSAAPNISCQEDTQIVPEEEDDDWDTDSDLSADDALTHRGGTPESASTDLSRYFLPKSSTRRGAPPASTS